MSKQPPKPPAPPVHTPRRGTLHGSSTPLPEDTPLLSPSEAGAVTRTLSSGPAAVPKHRYSPNTKGPPSVVPPTVVVVPTTTAVPHPPSHPPKPPHTIPAPLIGITEPSGHFGDGSREDVRGRSDSNLSHGSPLDGPVRQQSAETISERSHKQKKNKHAKAGGKGSAEALISNSGLKSGLLSADDLDKFNELREEKRKQQKQSKISPKSLFFCLCLESPFQEEDQPEPVVDERMFTPQLLSCDATTGKVLSPHCHLQDDDFLLQNVNPRKPTAPNRFQKIIEILLRLDSRGIDVRPPFMLKRTANDNSPNYFHGWMLDEEECLLSPDRDEIYIKLHATSHVLLQFAEAQGIPLLSHEYSFSGGEAVPFSRDMDRRLTQSVSLYHKCYGVPRHMLGKNGEPFGFHFDTPHKMRMLVRLMREPWRFGGCGLQINEMKNNGILIKHFFPLHNPEYLADKGLHKWAALRALVSRNPLTQDANAIISYFGEQVALYFVWLRKMTLFLRYLALAGLVAGIMNAAGFYRGVVNASFALICVIWGGIWCIYWARREAEFSVVHSQEEQMSQEPVRDEFSPASEQEVNYKDIYDLNFRTPLTLQTRSDGSMINLYYSECKRTCTRYLLSYPVIVILTASMAAAMIYVTHLRFTYPNDKLINYGSSIGTVVISNVFGFVFQKMITFLNARENMRTESEYEAQTITKSFFFYFFSYYLANFLIMLYPLPASVSDTVRMEQLESQMLIICVIKPMIQNIQELATPVIKSELRVRVDIAGWCGALCSILCCCSRARLARRYGLDLDDDGQHKDSSAPSPRSPNRNRTTSLPLSAASTQLINGAGLKKKAQSGLTAGAHLDPGEGRWMWEQAQLEPYESTSDDYLEITLQFGYMTMFASTFPWAPVAALVYNALELRIDAKKMSYYVQRTLARPATNIGPWRHILLLLTMAGVVTNAYIVFHLGDASETLKLSSETDRWKCFIVLQYIALFVMVGCLATVGTTPEIFYQTRAKRHLLENRAVRERICHLFSDTIAQREQLEAAAGLTTRIALENGMQGRPPQPRK